MNKHVRSTPIACSRAVRDQLGYYGGKGTVTGDSAQSREGGTLSISIATDQILPSNSMIDMIKKGVAHGIMGGDGKAGRETSVGSLERAPGSLEERCLKSADPLTLSVESRWNPFYNYS